ncbi:MAG: sulfatase-like hydrolase/transferase [Isosphaeraceae bacterium]|nr:sulfatase-like hydrolase/transferase [Isosphaeraceae bacterium]
MPIRLYASICILSLGSIAAAADRPNVLLICVDDLKPAIGCYGDPLAKTPAIDALAKRGVRFDRAYCNQAVCAPSRNALLTGLRPQTLGIYDLGTNFRLSRPDAITLPQHFKNHGYRTEALGKIFHVGHGNHEDPASWSAPHWKSEVVAYVLPESKPKNAKLTREEARFAGKDPGILPKGAAVEIADVADEAYPDGAVAAEAVARLRAARDRPGQPFFLAVGFVKPHLPFCAPKKYWDLHDRNRFSLAERTTPPAGAPDYAPQFGGELRQYAGIPEKGDLDPELQRTLIHGYYAAASYMDAQVGKLIAELDRLDLARNTIIVLWGDHGWHLGDHGIWCKHTNYEQASRIPLIVVAPGSGAVGKTSSAAVETVDIYPTLAALGGLPAPEGLDGRGFVDHVVDPAKPSTRDSVIHVYPRGKRLGRAIRTERHRLVEWKPIGAPASEAEFELYDYATDPLETRNLAAEQPEVVARLQALLARHPEAKKQIPRPAAAAEPAAPKRDRAAMFRGRDKDDDGRLTRAEFLANQPDPDKAPQRFITFDTNKDGHLSLDEFVSMGSARP